MLLYHTPDGYFVVKFKDYINRPWVSHRISHFTVSAVKGY